MSVGKKGPLRLYTGKDLNIQKKTFLRLLLKKIYLNRDKYIIIPNLLINILMITNYRIKVIYSAIFVKKWACEIYILHWFNNVAILA